MTRIVMAFLSGLLVTSWSTGAWPLLPLAIGLTSPLRRRAPGLLAGYTAGMAAFLLALHDHQVRRIDGGQEPVPVAGRIVGLPDQDAAGLTRFRLRTRSCEGCGVEDGRLLLITWPDAPALGPGDRLHLHARLRAPRGTLNPGTFDFETWALTEHLHGTGFVRTGVVLERGGRGIDQFRHRLATDLMAVRPEQGSIMSALALGDRRELEASLTEAFRTTGTAHLLAISGLHIGLVAGLGALVGRWVFAVFGRWFAFQARPVWIAVAAWWPAFAYAAMAGFSLPTRRALVMLSIWVVLTVLRRRSGLIDAWALALLLTLVMDPLAVLSGGFWLSYVAVLVLLLFADRPSGRLWSAQWVVGVGLLPLMLALGLPVHPASSLVNLLAVPWLGVGVLPALLAGVGWLALFGTDSAMLGVAGVTLDTLVAGLTWVAEREGHWMPATLDGGTLLLLAWGCALLLVPRGLPLRVPGGLCLALGVVLAAAPSSPSEPEVHVIDVGQGLAVLVRTRQHAMLYDAGPVGRTGWDAGRSIVLPYLQGLGVTRLDRVVLSHGDLDHAGGASSIAASIDVSHWLGSDISLGGQPCLAGQRWHWDGVDFEVLHPTPGLPYLGNDSSCVIRIRHGRSRFLLSGDIGEAVEMRLARDIDTVDAALVPHHGSGSSSSDVWLDAIRPDFTIASAGHANRFGMPVPRVLDRHRQRGIPLLTTAGCGRIMVALPAQGRAVWRTAARLEQHRRWRPSPDCEAPQTAPTKTSIIAGFR